MQISTSTRQAVITTLSLMWLAGISLGLSRAERYNAHPGQAAAAPSAWPHGTVLRQAADGLTLIMAVHPQCPCSRASLAELAQLMARSQGRIHATVVFLQYPGVSAQWVQTDTWRQAQSIPGVQVVRDSDGMIAHQFGALTSGQTYMYDKTGRLLFSGGLTGERGHEGDNAGLQATLALVRGACPALTRTPVFGCPLFSHAQASEKTCPRPL